MIVNPRNRYLGLDYSAQAMRAWLSRLALGMRIGTTGSPRQHDGLSEMSSVPPGSCQSSPRLHSTIRSPLHRSPTGRRLLVVMQMRPTGGRPAGCASGPICGFGRPGNGGER